MIDVLRSVLAHSDAFRWLFFLALLWAFYRWMEGNNGIEWRDFISAEKPDGTYRGDINRAGQCFGVGVAVYSVVATAPQAHTNFAGFGVLLGAALLFLCGPAGYAAFLRSKQGRIETTTVEEPLPVPSGPVKKTVVTNEPAAPDPTNEPALVKIVQGPDEPPIKVKEDTK